MANISGVQANIPAIKKSYKKLVALGEKALGDEYKLEIEGYSNLTYLVSNVQLPPMMRENVETYGPHGVQFNQQGRFKNAQDVPITFDEVISGEAYSALRDWVREKKYLQVTLGLVSESLTTSSASTTVVLEDCWIELEGVDLSNEDGASVVKPSGTLHANWVGWLDDEGTTVSMD